MPVLGALIQALFGGVAAWFASALAKRLAIAAAAIAGLATITAALLAVYQAAVSPLIEQAFATQYGQVIGLAFPPVAGNCLAALGVCWAAGVVYRWKLAAIRISAGAG